MNHCLKPVSGRVRLVVMILWVEGATQYIHVITFLLFMLNHSQTPNEKKNKE